MKQVKPLAIALAAIVGLFALVFGAIGWIESDSGRRWLERKASEASGRDVTIGRIEVRLGWRPGIRINGLRIPNPEWAKSRYLLDTQYIDAQFRLLPLFYGRPVVENLTLVQTRVGVERRDESQHVDVQKEGRGARQTSSGRRATHQHRSWTCVFP